MKPSKYYHEDIKRVKSIEFCILSNEEVKKMSAVKKDPLGITLPESYTKFEPQKGGLVDLRMGTCDPHLNCSTCGLNTRDCPGHFGHTELPDYFFHFGYLNHLKVILQCVCVRCSSLLVENNAELYELYKTKKGKVRHQLIKELAKKARYCYNCGAPVPKVKREVKETGAIKLILEQEVSQDVEDENTGDVNEIKKKIREEFSPRQIYEIMSRIKETDVFLLGFNPKEGHPKDFMIKTFPVPPVIIRPSAKIDMLASSTQEDSLTLKIADIVKKSNDLRNKMSKEQGKGDISTAVSDANTLLQIHLAVYFDNENSNLPKSEFKTGGRTTKSVSERIKGKQGRVRNNLMGKRVNYCARSVITCDPNLNIDEVGIPLKIAKVLTVPEIVTPQNIKNLSRLIRNGDSVYPGANFVTKNINVDGRVSVQRIDLRIRKKALKLDFGDIVDRHLVDGDYILFNRQPSLHKPSMMGHKVRVSKSENVNTFRFNVSAAKPYNADFDGDEMNLFLPQEIQARTELEMIANVKYQIVSAKNSNPIIGCQLDAVAGSYLLSLDGVNVSSEEACYLLGNTDGSNLVDVKKDSILTGKEVFSNIIPEGINSSKKKDDKYIFRVKNGELIKGVLDSSKVSSKKNSLIHFVWDKKGGDYTRKFIDDTQKLAINYLMYRGFTVGFGDCFIDKKLMEDIRDQIREKLLEVQYEMTDMENQYDSIGVDTYENSLTNMLNTFGSNLHKIASDNLDKDNGFYVMSLGARSKGSQLNIGKMVSCTSQQNVEGKRPRKRVNGRTLAHFGFNDDTPEARGFISNNFLIGLRGHQFFFYSIAGREGLIDTALKTSSTGYIQRKLIKSLEDMVVNYDGTVRNSTGQIIQFIYGDNGIDQLVQADNKINSLLMNNKEIRENYILNSKELKTTKTSNKVNEDYYKLMIELRDKIRVSYLEGSLDKILTDNFLLPINLFRLVQDITDETRKLKNDLSGDYILSKIEDILSDIKTDLNAKSNIKELKSIQDENERHNKLLIRLGLMEYLSPKKCLNEYKINKSEFEILVDEIKLSFLKAIVNPGEMVGVITAQSIGEPATQMSLLSEEKLRLIKYDRNIGEYIMIHDEIGKICDKLIGENPEGTYNTGHYDSIETRVDEDYYIVGVDENERTNWNKISHVSRHPVNGKMLRVLTKSGRRTVTTLSHSHLKRDGVLNKIIPVKGSELEIGDMIPVCKKISNIVLVECKESGFELYNSLCDENYEDIMSKIYLGSNRLKEEFIMEFMKKNKTSDYRLIKDIVLLLNYLGIFKSIKEKEDYYYLDDVIEYVPDVGLLMESINRKLGMDCKYDNILSKDDIIDIYTILNSEGGLEWELEILKRIIDSDVVWDEIIEMEIVEGGNVYVYDLTVPGNETFMNDCGVLVHNTLNTKHVAGVASASAATSGVPRVEELLSYSKNIKTPLMTLFLEKENRNNNSLVKSFTNYLNNIKIEEVINKSEIYYYLEGDKEGNSDIRKDDVGNAFYLNSQKKNMNMFPWLIRLQLDREKMLDLDVTLLDIKTKILQHYTNINQNLKNLKKDDKDIWNSIIGGAVLSNLDTSDIPTIHIRLGLSNVSYHILTHYLKLILTDINLKGLNKIESAEMSEVLINDIDNKDGNVEKLKELSITTIGINVEEIRKFKYLDQDRTYINDMETILKYYGIEGVRSYLTIELQRTFRAGGVDDLNYNHLSVISDFMTYTGEIVSIDRHGINRVDMDPLAKASFEKTMEQFVNASIYNEKDKVRATSSKIMLGQVIPGGTGAFELLLDTMKLANSEYLDDEYQGRRTFEGLEENDFMKDIIDNDELNVDFLF